MMSTTGRSPVIAAPTPMPVNPGSEIGVSITRDLSELFHHPGQNFERSARFGDVFAHDEHASGRGAFPRTALRAPLPPSSIRARLLQA